MISNRHLFYQNVAQTSDFPVAIEVERAEGVYFYSSDGKKYFDLISGVSVCNLGHGHPSVKEAAKQQMDKYMHLMVYGEYIQSPQTKLASKICELLPEPFDNVFFVNSGSEANEGALKLAKRYTGRREIIAFKNAYHGGTHGVLSLMSNPEQSNAFAPLLPEIKLLNYNKIEDLEAITEKTACVVVELIQAEAGIIEGNVEFMHKLREKCNETGALLIADEIQTGMGRTGKLFAFEHYNIVPDILTVAKAFGAGMPLGAFISSKEIMGTLKTNPILGHITTFGGHPVCCAASLAGLKVLLDEKIIESVEAKGQFFRDNLKHHEIRSIRGKGLFLAVELENFEKVSKLLKICIKNGLVFDWFLYESNFLRVAPPLTISDDEIIEVCKLMLKSLDEL